MAASIRRRLLLGAIASTLLALVLFAGGLFAVILIADADTKIIVEGEERETFQEEVAEIIGFAMLAAAPLALGAAAVTAIVLSRRIAKPVDDAIRAARETTAHDLQRRLPVPDRDDELRELTLALNDLFARLDDGFGALARFAADASHELRTPLAVMGTELEVALRHPRSVEEWEASGWTTLEQLQRLSALVDGLLALARAGADAPNTRVELDVIERVDAVVAQLSTSAEDAGITLAGPTGAAPRRVAGNPVTIETAIRNLVENALAATPRGGRVCIEVELATTDVIVTVDDDGPGMGTDPEAMFAPFVRGARSSETGRNGIGLGLAIARRIAQAHGGRLDAGDSPLGGARFTLAIPRGARA